MAKTYKNLFEELTSFKNLLLAAGKSQKGKRMKPNTAKFTFFLEKELLRLQQELLSRTYRPGTYRSFFVYEPKPRLISAAPYRDRVVHHAFCNVIEPIFDKTFIFDSYACRIDKGTHIALDRAQRFLRAAKFGLQCDIQKYFPSINHDILLSIIARKIKDEKVLWLAKLIIDFSPQFNEPQTTNHGIPIGNLTSQFFANLYLNELDYFVKFDLRERYYIRYMDDFLIFGNHRAHLNRRKADIVQFLETRLKLKLHPKKSVIFPVKAGVEFLGFRIFKDYRWLKKENIKRFLKRMKNLQKLLSQGLISINEVSNSLRCWIAHASYGNTYNLRKKILPKIGFPMESLSE